MSYLKTFRERLATKDYPSFLQLWEEYCYSDEPDPVELEEILEEAKASSLAHSFGHHVERGIVLWRKILDKDASHKIIKLIFDIQVTNSETLAELAFEYLSSRYNEDPQFEQKLRLIGLYSRENFQGSLSNFDLLTHIETHKFVFHTGGWGTGEVLEVSLIREELTLEFDYVVGSRSLSFQNAFKTLLPLADDHFLSRRFGNPDLLEKHARENPLEVMRSLLRDLGPKTAAEIKEELYDLVIPSKDWNRWWQSARAKMKKDTMIESPKKIQDDFRLREKEVPHEITLHKALESKPGVNETISMIYTFLRDFPETIKSAEFQKSLHTRLTESLKSDDLDESQTLQIQFFLEDIGGKKENTTTESLIKKTKDVEGLINRIEILAFKKRALLIVRKVRKDWKEIFLKMFFTLSQNLLRDYILDQLKKDTESLQKKMKELLAHPFSFPEVFVWYFQKIISPKSTLPFSDTDGKNDFFENFMILLDYACKRPEYRELSKKMVVILTNDRFKLVRDIMKNSSIEQIKEYMLLATKCEILTDHDQKIFYSLGEVVFPSLAKLRKKGKDAEEENVIWTTREGYQKLQERINHIATVETVENAKEIEEARALGDLRENAEFKAALERRDRLQNDLKMLSSQLSAARILSKEDVPSKAVGVGSVVHCLDVGGKKTEFTILGPLEADPDLQILSFQSKLARSMIGCKIGEKFTFQNEEYVIEKIDNYFDLK